MNQIAINHYGKSFGHKTVFKNFNLMIKSGEMVAITGPSGSGKTTLLNAIGLIDEVKNGEYYFEGHLAPKPNTKAAMQLIRTQISYLFQNFALVDNFSVEENLLMALKYTSLSKKEKNATINASLDKVGLSGYESLKVFEISGGEQQRVSIARSIIKPSSLILADEPTGALDVKNRDEVMDILRKINQSGKTIVVVTHDDIVAQRCDRIVHIN